MECCEEAVVILGGLEKLAASVAEAKGMPIDDRSIDDIFKKIGFDPVDFLNQYINPKKDAKIWVRVPYGGAWAIFENIDPKKELIADKNYFTKELIKLASEDRRGMIYAGGLGHLFGGRRPEDGLDDWITENKMAGYPPGIIGRITNKINSIFEKVIPDSYAGRVTSGLDKLKKFARKAGPIVAIGAILGGLLACGSPIASAQGENSSFTLEQIAKDPGLLNQIDPWPSKFLPEYMANQGFSIRILDSGTVLTITPESQRHGGGVCIEDNKTDIANLRKVLDSKKIPYEASPSSLDTSLEDFLRYTPEIEESLRLNATKYSSYKSTIFEHMLRINLGDIKVVPYEKFDYNAEPSPQPLGVELRRESIITALEELAKNEPGAKLYLNPSAPIYKNETGAKFYFIDGSTENASNYMPRKSLRTQFIIDGNYTFAHFWIDEEYPSPNEAEQLEKFEELFLRDMSQKGYFELDNGNWIPTPKFNETAKKNPQVLMEDMFSTIDGRVSYDWKNYIAGKFESRLGFTGLSENSGLGIGCYEIGKCGCSGTSNIATEGWGILQEYGGSELYGIEVFRMFDAPTMNHQWNGIMLNNKITAFDLTWYGMPLGGSEKYDLCAVDNAHFFTKKNN
ncbi:hypothetical protein KY347_03445 [Candidatus Woesearchaeota archaeon]|nr:hypothetical protein [Candidatus Woesearchaeota archaeon]